MLGRLLALLVLVTAANADVLQVRFSPKGGCAKLLCDSIAMAKKTLTCVVYNFTREDVVAALVAAKKRGVDVRVVLDKSQIKAPKSAYAPLLAAKIPVRIDSKHQIQHNKTAVIDTRYVVTGSFNWSVSAEDSNAENILLIDDAKTAAWYTKDWEIHWGHSK